MMAKAKYSSFYVSLKWYVQNGSKHYANYQAN